jgi:hypothetical protein
MDTNQPTPAKGLPELTQEEFERLRVAAGIKRYDACSYAHARRIARGAYQMGADVELEACCQWLHSKGLFQLVIDLRAARRPKPPTLKEQALAILDDCNLDAAHENTLRRALEDLPE